MISEGKWFGFDNDDIGLCFDTNLWKMTKASTAHLLGSQEHQPFLALLESHHHPMDC